jgi:hypothetical protein
MDFLAKMANRRTGKQPVGAFPCFGTTRTGSKGFSQRQENGAPPTKPPNYWKAGIYARRTGDRGQSGRCAAFVSNNP